MYKKMLVPLDGSKLAEAILDYARELARRLDLELVLIHICSSEESELLPMHRAYVERAAEIVTNKTQKVRENTEIQPVAKTIEARAECKLGYPAEEILNYADKNNIDIILMATHGRSGIRDWVLGSVAEKVLLKSKVPVWIVPSGIPHEIVYDQWRNRKILVPLDGSKLSELVLPHAEELAKQRGTDLVELVLLRVCEPADMVSPAGYNLTPDTSSAKPLKREEYMKQEIEKCHQLVGEYLAGIEKRLKDVGLKVHSETMIGEPAGEIVKYASQNPFNLIVMGSHGRSGVTTWAYGSVVNKVLHAIPTPIFLVRSN